MGKDKEKSSTTNITNQSTTQQMTPQATPEERKLNQLEIERIEATQPGQIQAQQGGLSLINQLLSGEEPLPGFFQDLSQGISPEVTSGIVQESLRDLYPQFQGQGILDSGVAAEIAGRTAGDIRLGSEQYNQGNKFNLLNLALSGQAQVQQPLLAQSQILSGRLAGLRSVSSTGNVSGTTSGTQTITGANPFLNSFQTSAGQFLGSLGGQSYAAKEFWK